MNLTVTMAIKDTCIQYKCLHILKLFILLVNFNSFDHWTNFNQT